MPKTTTEFEVMCKRCNTEKIGYSGMMYEKMKGYGQSRPEYCENCRKALLLEKMTMGAAYFSVKTLPGEDLTIALPGELGMVYHPQRPHVKAEKATTFDAGKFGATPDKIVDVYKWLKDKNHQVAIIIGETGSGKSTALPYWLIYPPVGVPKDFFTRDGQILITQPRIVATTSIAKYLGSLLGSSVGKGFDIGYRYSKDRNNDRFNAAFLATDGSLINMIMNGQLSDLSVIMIDEAHERSENIDIILRLLKDQLPLYPHLKLLIVSATINKESFLKYFGEDTASVIEFEAKRKFEYKKVFATEKEKLPYEDLHKLRDCLVPALVAKVLWLLDEQVAGRKTLEVVIDKRKVKANTLAFLQGVKPIEEAVNALTKAIAASPTLRNKVEVYPLYSDLEEKKKDLALEGSGSGKIRVIISTNVAEASVTVKGIVYVVETGVENQANWKSDTLQTKVGLNLISQANAKQRWGRSGRTAPGEVYCLYTEEQFNRMLPFPVPAIQRSSMEDVILLLKKLGVDELDSGWIDNPNGTELTRSMDSLHKSGAIDEDDRLTEYGSMLKEFAYTATLADLIIMSDRFGCAVEVATILPVIKNGGHKYLLARNDEWDKKEQQKAKAAHQILWKNCKDDVEFILKLYSLWRERGEKWAKEFYVNHEVFKDIEAERTQILRLLNGHKKDSNFRAIDFKLVDRTRVILAYCVPFTVVPEGTYSYKANLQTASGTSAAYQMVLSEKKKKIVDENIANTRSLFALARELVEIAKDSEADDVYARVFADANLTLEEAISLLEDEQKDKILNTYAVGQTLEAKVTGFADYGTFVRLPLGNSGMIHISKMGKWVKKPSEMLTVGDLVEVEVLEMKEEKEKVRIGLKLKSVIKKA
ncbi:MAG: hypothetical protein ACD_61C00305G0001 [uncultured bacterium]|nr:MAG: hypothetical protein ACD_61C00305G0001 [uncultured bacterium]